MGRMVAEQGLLGGTLGMILNFPLVSGLGVMDWVSGSRVGGVNVRVRVCGLEGLKGEKADTNVRTGDVQGSFTEHYSESRYQGR